MFFKKKKVSYGNTGQTSATYVPNYMQPMPYSAPPATAVPPMGHAHYGAPPPQGLQPPQAIPPGAASAYPPPPLPSRPHQPQQQYMPAPSECALPPRPHSAYCAPQATGPYHHSPPGLASRHSAYAAPQQLV